MRRNPRFRTGISLGCQQRIGAPHPAVFRTAYYCGCRWIIYGIESGNEERLKKIRKNIPYDQKKSSFEPCNEIGLISIATFIIDLPDETPAQLEESIDMSWRL